MALYRRFVTYLFLYEDRKKGENCGFAKVDTRQGRCRIEVQMKGCTDGEYCIYMLYNACRNTDEEQSDEDAGKREVKDGGAQKELRERKCSTCSLEEEASGEEEAARSTCSFDWKPAGIEIGVICVSDGFGSAVYLLDAEKIAGTVFGLEDIFGIYLTAGGDRFIASQWEDGEVDWGSFRADNREEWDGANKTPVDDVSTAVTTIGESVSGEGEQAEKVNTADERENAVKAGAGDCTETGTGKESKVHPEGSGIPDQESAETEHGRAETEKFGESGSNNINAAGSEDLRTQPEVQATQAAAAADIFPYMSAWEKQWQQFCARHPVFCPFDEVKNTYAVKVDLRDLRKLPKQYWPLANNSFLLHGYFSYRYLIFGCEDGEKKKWFVAVPGVFQNQEQMMAGIFGFTGFRTKQVTKQKTGEFGYWYRYLEI